MTNKHIEFEVQVKSSGLGGLFGGGATAPSSDDSSSASESPGEYEVATEEDIGTLARILGG